VPFGYTRVHRVLASRIVEMDALIIERKMDARSWPFFFQKYECAMRNRLWFFRIIPALVILFASVRGFMLDASAHFFRLPFSPSFFSLGESLFFFRLNRHLKIPADTSSLSLFLSLCLFFRCPASNFRVCTYVRQLQSSHSARSIARHERTKRGWMDDPNSDF